MKTKKEKILYFLLLVISTYIGTVNMIQAFKNPELTNTQLFIKIPDSLILKFE